jgi:hypothetical protein
MTDPELIHFVQAQDEVRRAVVAELSAGRKRTHWMWFVFPQLTGLARSSMEERYAIRDLEQARRYLADPTLGERLRLIAQAGANFEDRIVGSDREEVRHHRNHERLGDRLIEADRQWPVQVGVWLDLDRHELMPRYLSHRTEDPIVQCSFANLGGEVLCDHSDRRNHLSSLSLKVCGAHEASSR